MDNKDHFEQSKKADQVNPPNPKVGEQVKCSDCGGTGDIPPNKYATGKAPLPGRTMTCNTCKGTGWREYDENGQLVPSDGPEEEPSED